MKKLIILFVLIVAPFYATAIDVGGSLTYGSDYVWRGVSQKGSPALSVGIEADHNGLYGGAWASQVDYGDDSDYEYDFYAGYGFDINDELSFDVGVIQYNFNNEPQNRLEEWYVGGTFKGFTATYWRDFENSDNHFAEYSYAIPIDGVSLSVFWQDPNDFYGINISKDLEDFTLMASIGQDRDTSNNEAVVSVAYNF